ncbi:TetR/AcrR family transcriptional regulator [Frondihabitans australicus]|uniref:TetR family transcriptional regulator n=1 Tax=Frondihabitans australicus TaxID=386892 RepID=A0A495IHI1_9MICO|nr:TetR/AcrR family transcriptional regulator [Frondihabitans australicus]RKR75219.1 TetR family transcriptional regulator [Frondihabitans australicus]
MTPATPSTGRRADAEQNRARILDAAREAFADPDADVSMAEVARRAGVGMATLYRNYPGRRELLEALYADEVDAICAWAGAVDGATPADRLDAWLSQFAAFIASKRLVGRELLKHTDSADPVFGDARSRVIEAARPLLDAARESGEVRPELTIDQVVDLVHAVAVISGDRDYVRPILRAALDGIRRSAPR